MSNVIQIERIEIKLDTEGRYCLNDLHKAAGGEPKHTPGRFTCTDTFMELCEELSRNQDESPISSKAGRGGGTFVCRELVYAYAMWISPAFHLKVIRAFDRMNTQGIAVADHAAEDLLNNPLKYFERVLEQAKELQAKLALDKPEAGVLYVHWVYKRERL